MLGSIFNYSNQVQTKNYFELVLREEGGKGKGNLPLTKKRHVGKNAGIHLACMIQA